MLKLRLLESRLGLRNSTARIPFRYGGACLTRCPQAVMEVCIEHSGGQQRGYSGDCLPPGWFDKSPQKSFRRQVEEMLSAIELAQQAFQRSFRKPETLFAGWRQAYDETHRQARQRGFTPLLATFAVSLLERAAIDAACRAMDKPLARAVRENLLEIDAGAVHKSLAGYSPADWLPEAPLPSVHVRHTVGLSDPLTESEIPPEQRLEDGWPQSLEEYLNRSGIHYLKIKVSNRLEHDLARLETIAALAEKHRGADYRVTLDGNEQYKSAAEFERLIAALQGSGRLATLWANTLLIEQPLDRKIALEEEHTAGIRALAENKPVILDESDGDLDSFVRAMQLGYRGVSSKNCKGPIKSLLNAGLVWLKNGKSRYREAAGQRFLMTGEDLCTVGVIPVQSDLCLTATLGLTHVERNGHHFQSGLAYLSPDEQQAALAAHGDFYTQNGNVVCPRLAEGSFAIGSLQCVGYGFAALPNMDRWAPPEEWSFDSLGLEE